MSNLAWMVAGNLAPAAAIYLVICWKDHCSKPVALDDDLGLCDEHRAELRG